MAVNILFLLILTLFEVDSLNLEQVLILSRHNVRAPLTKNLQRTTSFDWPPWDVPAGHLTEKGIMLEEIMGDYFSQWFKTKGLLTEECPNPDSVYVYSNNKQRTIQSAKVFTRAAFKNCEIAVHFNLGDKADQDHSDPVFAPVLRNTSESFRKSYTKQMEAKLNNLRLEDAYAVLDEIVDIKNSDVCKQDSFCDFNMQKDDIVLAMDEEPDLHGPLAVANFMVDFFLMSYYNGWPEKQIAWGRIKTEDDWKILLDITRANQNVRFNQSHLSRDIARPMLNYISDLFLKPNLARKLTVLVGHDSNLNTVMASLGFKKYNLAGQHESWPVGGKLVFQKWSDDDSNLFLKIEYIYESMKQLRNGTKLSIENPPLSQVMELQNCKIDEHGFCPWSDFVKVLETLY